MTIQMKLTLRDAARILRMPLVIVLDLFKAGTINLDLHDLIAYRTNIIEGNEELKGTQALTRFLQEEGFYDCAGQNDLIEE